MLDVGDVASNRVYLDHASTTPLLPEAREALLAGLELADPSRNHDEGLQARYALESARQRIADSLGARSREVVFTSGATESIVTATAGARSLDPNRQHVIHAAVEHAAVRESAAQGPVTVLGVDPNGMINIEEFAEAITEETCLVHLQHVNHEVATIQPIAELGELCRERGVLFHVDAAQSVGFVPVSFKSIGADFLSLSGHKFGGPSGIGALLIRRGLRVQPLIVGGDQERARRAGRENVAAAMGLAAAVETVTNDLVARQKRFGELTWRIRDWVGLTVGTSLLGHPTAASPQLVCVGIDGIEPQAVLLGLNSAGIAVHSGNSCSSEALEPSPVLEAMGVDAQHSLRISVGWTTTDEDISQLLDTLPRVIEDLRSLRS